MFFLSDKQKTIGVERTFFGRPRNRDRNVNVKLLPVNENYGIIFKRVDLKENNLIKLDFENVFFEQDILNIKNSFGVCVKDIEILLCCLWLFGINNLLIEVDNDSIPYMNGTCEMLIFLLETVEIKELTKQCQIHTIDTDITYTQANTLIELKKSVNFSITVSNENSSFLFDPNVLPFKQNFATTLIKSVSLKSNIISILAILFIGNKMCNFDLKINNFNKEICLSFFSNLYSY